MCRLHQDVWQAILVAVGRLLAGQYEQIGPGQGGEYGLLRLSTVPNAAVGYAKPRCQSLERFGESAATDMLEPPVQIARQACQGRQ